MVEIAVGDDEATATVHVLNEVAPLETAVVGKTTVDRLVRGQQFDSTDGGHHMDLTVAVGVVAATATIVHYTWILVAKTAEKWRSRDTKAMKDEVIENVQREVDAAENLRQALEQNPQLLSDVYDALDKLGEFRELVANVIDAAPPE